MTPQHSGYLVFRSDSDHVSCEAGEVLIDLVAEGDLAITSELLQNAAAAVLHYFLVEKGLKTVPLNQFADAMILVLRGFGFGVCREGDTPDKMRVTEANLELMVQDCGGALELAFFPRLRQELSEHLRTAPQMIRFTGLRPCVMQLAGSRRWGRRCQALSDRIVDYVRDCLGRAPEAAGCALVIK